MKYKELSFIAIQEVNLDLKLASVKANKQLTVDIANAETVVNVFNMQVNIKFNDVQNSKISKGTIIPAY